MRHVTTTTSARPERITESEPVYHLFREVNDHLRATEQKHLQVSVGFISVTALALSVLVVPRAQGGGAEPFRSWPETVAYLILLLAGCATMYAQHNYRGWKKEYLLAAKKLVYNWPIADAHRVNWMRRDRGPYANPDRAAYFRLAGDNVLFWFVVLITICVESLLFVSLWRLIHQLWIVLPVIALVFSAYASLFVHITGGGVARKDRLENDWDEFRAEQRSLAP
jgi:hypothetical protein